MIILDDFKLSKQNLNIIDKWTECFNNKKNIKPLIITGDKGIGKTTLANILLEKYSIITIDYNIINSEEYIKLLIGKKDISMMFSNKEYKAILIDDIFDIKKNINEFNNYFKYLQNNLNHPIIITLCNTNNKKLNVIINKCFHININYSKIIFNNCVKKILNNNNLKLNNIEFNNFIINCNKNFNSINENIKFLKHKTNNNNITQYLTTYNDINVITNNLIFKDINLDISDLFIKYNSDLNIIFFNIIDNIINLTNDYNIILELYNCILYSNYWDFIKNKLHIFNLDFDIFYFIVYPINKLKNTKINKYNIQYNKYISYSLQYINSINNYVLNTDVYYYFRKCLFNYDINTNQIKSIDILINYIKKYKLNKKNINSIIRLYYYLNNQKGKSYTNLINKLFK